MVGSFQVRGTNAAALFTLRVHRGEGMALLAMNWKRGEPPDDFVGFAIEYREPGGEKFFPVRNRLSFPAVDGDDDADVRSSLRSPIQKFRWVHFPFRADMPGAFTYRVTPVFMDDHDVLRAGEAQTIDIELRRETYPGKLNVTFTRGFVSSQAFVDRFEKNGEISTLLPDEAEDGLRFQPTHPDTEEALSWMGFEARGAVLEVLDQAIAHADAKVSVVAYDLSEPDVVGRLEQLGDRLRIIIDDSGEEHGGKHSGETQAAARLEASAGKDNVKRQHMGALQHNKTIVVSGTRLHKAICGSTNYSWRGFFVQNNNAVILSGKAATKPFLAAFEQYWETNSPSVFGTSPAAQWADLGLRGIDAKVAFSPHSSANALLNEVASDMEANTTSSLLYSLAFLAQTKGSVREAVTKLTERDDIFVFGMADKKVGGIDLQTPDGNRAPVNPARLGENAPEPFKSEPSGGSGIRLHHKFVVIDFDQPTGRVYLGSYNFSRPADRDNGENLLLIRDQRIAVAYMIEALRLFDHYQFRVKQSTAKKAGGSLGLRRPPRAAGEVPWWKKDYTEPTRIRDRLLFG
ncbi:MAG: phospholipase D-like domain-containing protein [Acidimicrobiales bacterium]